MDQLPPLGTNIGKIVGPTAGIYGPLLKSNAAAIRSTERREFSYGSHDRQKLDVYHPTKPSTIKDRRQVLIFCYGGGLVRGDKNLAAVGDGLAYANIGSFFAQKYGYTVIIPDYRLVGSHNAKFPSGGEDVALVIEWVCKNGIGNGAEPIDLFLMGNSAGGVHQSTFLFHPSFATTREKVSARSDVRLRGNVLLSVPFDFESSDPSRADVLKAYYDDYDSESARGLLESACKQSSISQSLKGMRFFVLNGSLDPEDEILEPRQRFLAQWAKFEDAKLRESMVDGMMEGHNHISPVCALGTGIEKEEAWGHQVASFFEEAHKSN